MFLSRNTKNIEYPCKAQFYYIEVGLKGSKLYRHVFVILCTTTEGGSVHVVSASATPRLLGCYCHLNYVPWSPGILTHLNITLQCVYFSRSTPYIFIMQDSHELPNIINTIKLTDLKCVDWSLNSNTNKTNCRYFDRNIFEMLVQ